MESSIPGSQSRIIFFLSILFSSFLNLNAPENFSGTGCVSTHPPESSHKIPGFLVRQIPGNRSPGNHPPTAFPHAR
jgi:hypothetical protein